MDTEYDFITPEFMHLLFFKQKNLVIYPHVDVKHLRGLETFTVGYTMVDMECTALYNFKDILQMPSDGNSKNFYLIYGLDKKKTSELIALENAHCILNVSESMTDIMSDAHEDFIFYNKKTGKFLNYNFDEEKIKFEHMLISLAKDPERVQTELLKIKNAAHQIYKGLNTEPEHMGISLILKDYNEEEYPKIFQFIENYYDITIPEQYKKQNTRFAPKKSNTTPQARFFEEFKTITSVNQKFTDELVKLLHTYKQRVNPSNMELEELHTPLLLYNYLREHHWAKGVPKTFVEEWAQMNHTNYALTDEDIEDFGVIMEKLGMAETDLHQVLGSIEAPESEEMISSDTKEKTKEVTTQPEDIEDIENEEESTHPENSSSQVQKPQTDPDSEPSIDAITDLSHFKKEVLSMVDEIEKNLKISDS